MGINLLQEEKKRIFKTLFFFKLFRHNTKLETNKTGFYKVESSLETQLRRLRQQDCKFEAGLGYRVTLSQKKNKTKQ